MKNYAKIISVIIMMFTVGCSDEKNQSSNIITDVYPDTGFRKSEKYAPCVMIRSGMSVVIVPLGFYDVMNLVSEKLLKDEGFNYRYFPRDLNGAHVFMIEGKSNGRRIVISYMPQEQSKLSYIDYAQFQCGPSIVYLGNAVIGRKFISQKEFGKIITEVLDDPQVESTNASHSSPENYEHRELRQFLELP